MKNNIALSGHVFRDESSPVQQLITWVPRHGWAKRGSLTTAHRNTLTRDTGIEDVRDPVSKKYLNVLKNFVTCKLFQTYASTQQPTQFPQPKF